MIPLNRHPNCLLLLATALFLGSALPTYAAERSDALQRAQSEFMAKASKARKEYRKELAKYARQAVGKYEKVAADAVRKGDLATATVAMREILKLDRNHKKATAHFQAIGRLEETLKELEKEPSLDLDAPTGSSGQLAKKLAGTTWTWGTKTITFSPNGIATAADDLRRWRVDSDGYVHVVSTQPAKYYSVVQFDSSVTKFSGKSYHLSNPNHTGKRIR